MTELMQIQSFLIPYVKAIASIVEAEVTVVDRDLVRIGQSGGYDDSVSHSISHASFFRRVMEQGSPGFIEDVRQEFICSVCDRREECKELANLVFPIFFSGKIVGVIAIVAFSVKQQNALIQNRVRLMEFLKYMSLLLESKLIAREEQDRLESQLDEMVLQENQTNTFDNFSTRNAEMSSVLQLAQKVSTGNSTIMIRGESGTGKELLAKAIHAASDRSGKILVAVNCASIPDNLAESELFGYEEGSFTGARKGGKPGKFELADGSTLFLDEIGDISLSLQAKLLRVLQEGQIDRVGGKHPIPVDVRVLCATNRNLEELVQNGDFREDLYYRLNVIPLTIPPLRQRREDIPPLLNHYMKHYACELHRPVPQLEDAALHALASYHWPGNIRELRNIVEYLVNICSGSIIRVTDLPNHFSNHSPSTRKGTNLEQQLGEYERSLYHSYFAKAASTEERLRVAAELGISRATLYRKLKKYNLLQSQD